MATRRTTTSVRKTVAPLARKAAGKSARAAKATTKARAKPKPKARTKAKVRKDDARIPKSVRAERDRSLDRYIERWARRLLIADKGVVRRLTEDEVEVMVGKKRTKTRRRA